MSKTEPSLDTSYLHMFEQVAPTYQHRQKFIEPGDALTTSDVYLKWYDIYRQETPIPAQFVHETHSFLRSELDVGTLPLKNELGFVIHHQCSAVYILYICTWRNENEVWETIYSKDVNNDGPFQLLERGSTAPTFCVWVLGVVWHEQQAWTRYLYSKRDDVAKHTYIHDQIIGLV
jgi:hypothetical protein